MEYLLKGIILICYFPAYVLINRNFNIVAFWEKIDTLNFNKELLPALLWISLLCILIKIIL